MVKKDMSKIKLFESKQARPVWDKTGQKQITPEQTGILKRRAGSQGGMIDAQGE
ncbi:MAG: hypothetical protein GY940_45120 [bacterium]|nr:hypothetical protein [bacterium]